MNTTAHELNADQIAYWNGPAGQRWADRQAAQDILLGPVADILIDRAKPVAGERVIDVGCGSGATTIAFARKVAPSGHVFGIDISAPMLARARASAPKDLPVDFVLADATVYPFDPASFDLLASRFGVMFFADPVLSFANMRKALQAVGAAGVRLLARAARKPLDDGAAAGGLQTRTETAAAGAGRSRTVRFCLRRARAPDSGRGRLHRTSRWRRARSSLDIAIGARS